MLRQPFRFAFVPVLALTCFGSVPAAADTIYKVDGSTIEDATIVTDGLLELVYKEGRSDKTLASDEILRIEFTKLPKEVDAAVTAIDEGQLNAAVGDLQVYLEEIEGGKKEKRAFAPAYARHLLVELQRTLGKPAEVVAAADALIEKSADSRYLPGAYLAKANAQAQTGKGGDAVNTLKALEGVVSAKGLSNRWTLEAQLGQILHDGSLAPDKRRGRLGSIASTAGDKVPTVRNRALVARAESFMAEEKRDEAETDFRAVAESGKADEATLAAAYTGIGDCMFEKASKLPGGSNEAVD
ncbi:MAG: hypothetical protein AAF368_10580, partial [Planctomycetota bacterium]